LPSPSKSIDWLAPLPFTWGLVVLLVCVHLLTGTLDTWRGYESLFDNLLMGRSTRMRVAVGGQLDLNIAQGEVFRFVTSTVLHGDALHLVVNAVALLGLGRLLEPLIGGARMLLFFTLGAVFASVVSYGFGVIQSDGASGGAFTLLALAVVLGWRHRREWDGEDRRLMGPVLWGFTTLNLVLSLALPFVDGIGHGAGFVAGIALAIWPEKMARRLSMGLGVIWAAIYCGALAFGAVWVFNGWTAEIWLHP
jgi:MYXO-CTERM domain-containing protein